VLEVRWTGLAAHEKQWRDALEIAEQELKSAAGGILRLAAPRLRLASSERRRIVASVGRAAAGGGKISGGTVIAYNLSCYGLPVAAARHRTPLLRCAVAAGQKDAIKKNGVGRRRPATVVGRNPGSVKNLKNILSVDGLRIERDARDSRRRGLACAAR